MSEVSFGSWLVRAFELANKKPGLWLGCVLVIGLLLTLGRVSLALGIVSAVASLFVGVGIVAAIDKDEPVNLLAVIKWQLPTALTLATVIMAFWFIFRVVANINGGELEKIAQFFFHWELTPENLTGKGLRDLMVWLYSAGIVALAFVVLMLASFGSWFSYPLMLFQGRGWFEARELGRQAFNQHAGAMLKLSGFLLLTALVGMGFIPLLTPLFYMLVATLMYVSYRDVFGGE